MLRLVGKSFSRYCQKQTTLAAQMKQALKAKAGFEKLNIPSGVYAANVSMSRMFQAKGEIQKAMHLIRSNIQLADTNMKLKAMHVLANIYVEQGELDSALAIDNEVIRNKTLYTEKFVSPFLNNGDWGKIIYFTTYCSQTCIAHL